MWQPANKAALPSPGDFKHAKKAIDELEDALKDALVVLEQAQSRVLALTKELDERKAWIAPIRKLPAELLSEIFICGSEIEHLAPVTITEVSRLWRAIALATPRAWSLIYVSAPEHRLCLDQYVSTFLERSNPCLLHIWIREDPYDDVDSDESEFESRADRVLSLLRASLSRIQCLFIGDGQLRKLSKECMPNLTRLRIMDFPYDIPPFFISGDKFPHLQSIRSAGRPWGDSLSLTSFPPLQELAIRINDRSTWLEVVKNCSATLKSLTIIGKLVWRERVTIVFPQLKSLVLSDWSSSIDPKIWLISMVTPRLISYDEFSSATAPSKVLHGDVRSVIYLRIRHIPNLAPYTSVRVLQFAPTYNSAYLACAREIAEQLRRDINTSPALELVEFRLLSSSEKHPELEQTKRVVIEKIKSARPGIELSFTRGLGPMPGSIEETSCESNMPCSYGPV